MSNKEAAKSPNSGVGLLTAAFVVQKLCHVIDWSWWWVFSPVLILIGCVIIAIIGQSIVEVLKEEGK